MSETQAPSTTTEAPTPVSGHPHHKLWPLVIGALGVVYGDIGTSPLYALRECFSEHYHLPVTPDNIFGLLSIVFWTLVFIISFKYLLFVMRADNRGEGGILALMALVSRGVSKGWLIIFGLFGAALLYADAMITPAISVLSALEGLNVATKVFEPFILPIAAFILVILFFFQDRGTTKVGAVFGPIMLVWFSVLGIFGFISILSTPSVLWAVNPFYMIHFFLNNGWTGFAVMGSVFLVVTGGEALYADMGHFGRKPIQIGWFSLVFPALLLNYFGQGALLIRRPDVVEHLFYEMFPSWMLYPAVLLATAATIIASQAVISGAFSLTRQAVQLGYCPRLAILQTSSAEIGQVYVPMANWALFAGTMALLFIFKHSSNLAAAYGVAVTATMLITSLLIYQAARQIWNWKKGPALALTIAFLIPDAFFFAANIIKIQSGGWMPLLVASWIYLSMITWKQGRALLRERMLNSTMPLDAFLDDIRENKPLRVPGLAIFLTANPQGVPSTLLHNFKHNKILHEKIILLTVRTEEIPIVPPEDQWKLDELGQGFYWITLHYGFSESPNILESLKKIQTHALKFELMKTTFFLGREMLLTTPKSKSPLSYWRRKLFIFMSRNAFDATQFFRIPPNRVVELGIQIEI